MKHPKPASVLYRAFDDSAGMQMVVFQQLTAYAQQARNDGDYETADALRDQALRAYDHAKAYAS